MPVDGDIILKAGLDTSGVTKRIDGLQKSISKGLKNVIRAGFGVRSVFALIRKLRSALFAGFGELAQVHEPFNQAMSSIMTSLNLLRNTFASAFAPIIETVAPMIVTFINLMANAVSAVGQFIAALTGKQYVAAGAVWKDYASSVDKSSKSTKNATSATKKQTKAQKELNKEITHFDDLVILHDKNDDNTDTTPAVSPDVGFAPAGIGDAVSQFAKDFKAALADWDFKDIGRTISEKLRKALEKIPWETEIYPAANNFGKGLATFLNGLITPELFSVIGGTVADVLNTALHFLDSFGTWFDWKNFGTSLASGVNSFFEKWDADLTADVFSKFINGIQKAMTAALANFSAYSVGSKISGAIKKTLSQIEWKDVFSTLSLLGTKLASFLNGLIKPETFEIIGTTLANVLTSIFMFLNNFGSTFNWTNFGYSIGNSLNSAINSFSWSTLSDTLSNAINGVFTTWYTFVTTFDFLKFGTEIGTSLSDAIISIDWKNGAASVAQTINGLLDALRGFVIATDWKSLGKLVIATLISFFSTINWTNIGQTISSAITGLFNFLIGTFQGIKWEELPGMIIDAIVDLLTGFNWEETAKTVGEYLGGHFLNLVKVGEQLWSDMLEFGQAIIDGGLQGIKDALTGIVTWIKENVVDPFIAGFKSAFGIASPATTMMPIGGFIVSGIFEGIKNVISSIASWLKENVVDPFINNLNSLFGFNGQDSEFIKMGKNLVSAIKAGAADIMTSVGGWIQSTIVEPFITHINTFFGFIGGSASALVDIGKNIVSSIKAGAANIMITIGDWLKSTIVDPFVDTITNLFGLDGGTPVLLDIGKNLLEGLKNGLLDAMNGIGTWIDTNVTGPILGFFKELFGIDSPSKVFKDYGGYLMQGLENGVEDNVDLPLDAVKGAQSAMSDVFGTLQQLLNWAKLGSNIMSLGLTAGIIAKTPELLLRISTLESSMRTTISNKYATWKTLGSTLLSNFKNGIVSTEETTVSAIATILSALETKIEEYYESFVTQGATLAGKLDSGISSAEETLKTTVGGLAEAIQTKIGEYSLYSQGSTLVQTLCDGMNDLIARETLTTGIETLMTTIHSKAEEKDFTDVGSNIGYGIYDGLIAQSEVLQILAWNTAVDMYNSACEALGIASPSKKFAWVGEMITAGLGDGVKDNADYAIDATEGLVNSIYSVTEDATPAIAVDTSIGNWIDTLDSVLTTFSNTVTTKFDELINYLSNLNTTSLTLPPVAQGKVIPSSMRASNDTDNMTGLINALQDITYDRLTTDDLRTLLVEMFTQYMNFGFYLGDEQIARHANNGNVKLSRKYNTI